MPELLLRCPVIPYRTAGSVLLNNSTAGGDMRRVVMAARCNYCRRSIQRAVPALKGIGRTDLPGHAVSLVLAAQVDGPATRDMLTSSPSRVPGYPQSLHTVRSSLP